MILRLMPSQGLQISIWELGVIQGPGNPGFYGSETSESGSFPQTMGLHSEALPHQEDLQLHLGPPPHGKKAPAG